MNLEKAMNSENTVEKRQHQFVAAFESYDKIRKDSVIRARNRNELPRRIVELEKQLEIDNKKLIEALNSNIAGVGGDKEIFDARAAVAETEKLISHTRELIQTNDRHGIGFSREHQHARTIYEEAKSTFCTAHARAITEKLFTEKFCDQLYAAFAAARNSDPVGWDIFLDAVIPKPFTESITGPQFGDKFVTHFEKFEREHINPVINANVPDISHDI
jgi:hypothetical protein